MPIIPRGTENARMTVSSPVPIGGYQEAGYSGQLQAKLGEEIQQFASQQIHVSRTLAMEEGKNAIQDVAVKAKDFADKNAAADGSDYGQKMQEYSQPLMDAIQNKYQDPAVSKHINSFASIVQGHMETSAVIGGASRLEQFNHDKVQQLGMDSVNRLEENPRLASVEAKNFTEALDKVGEGGMGADNVAALKKWYFGEASAGLVRGLIQKKDFNPAARLLHANQENPDMFTKLDPAEAQKAGFIDQKEAQALASQGKTYDIPVLTKNGKNQLTDGEAQIMSHMDPLKKAHFIDVLAAHAQQDADNKVSLITSAIDSIKKMAAKGDFTDQAANTVMNQINGNNKLPTSAKVIGLDQVISGKVLNSQMQLIANTPIDQRDKILEGFKAKLKTANEEATKFDSRMAAANDTSTVVGVVAAGNRAHYESILASAIENAGKEDKKDPAKAALAGNPKLQDAYKGSLDHSPEGTQPYVQQLLAQQKYLGIPETILQKADVSAMANTLKQMPSSGDMATAIDKLQLQYGQYFPKVMSELAAHDKELLDYKVIGYASPDSRAKVIDAIKNEAATTKKLGSDENLRIISRSALIAINSTLRPFEAAVVGGGNDSNRLETVNAMHRLVEVQVRNQIAKGGVNEKNAVDVVKNAYKEIIGNTYDIANGGNNSSVLVPKKIGNTNIQTDVVSGFLKGYSTADGLKELNPVVPSKYDNAEDYYKNLAKNSRWVNTEDQSGIRLMEIDNGGRLQIKYNNLGKPIEFNLEDISNNPPQRAKDANGFFKGRFGN